MGQNNKQKTLVHHLMINIRPDQHTKLIDLKNQKKGLTIGKIIRKLIDEITIN